MRPLGCFAIDCDGASLHIVLLQHAVQFLDCGPFVAAELAQGPVPVMPCGLLVAISGILAGGILGFRDAGLVCCFCTFFAILQ